MRDLILLGEQFGPSLWLGCRWAYDRFVLRYSFDPGAIAPMCHPIRAPPELLEWSRTLPSMGSLVPPEGSRQHGYPRQLVSQNDRLRAPVASLFMPPNRSIAPHSLTIAADMTKFIAAGPKSRRGPGPKT